MMVGPRQLRTRAWTWTWTSSGAVLVVLYFELRLFLSLPIWFAGLARLFAARHWHAGRPIGASPQHLHSNQARPQSLLTLDFCTQPLSVAHFLCLHIVRYASPSRPPDSGQWCELVQHLEHARIFLVHIWLKARRPREDFTEGQRSALGSRPCVSCELLHWLSCPHRSRPFAGILPSTPAISATLVQDVPSLLHLLSPQSLKRPKLQLCYFFTPQPLYVYFRQPELFCRLLPG